MSKKARIRGQRLRMMQVDEVQHGALERLHALYDELPTIECKGLCSNACGPIDMTDVERDRLVELGVTIPVFTVEASQAWSEGARLDCPALTPVTGHPLAPKLRMAKCTVYEDRPLICRLWGLTESMRCSAGCEPSRVLTDAEGYDFVFRAMEIGGHRHFGDARSFRAMKEAFTEFQDDPELGPLITRFIQGDRSIEQELATAIRARREAKA